MKVVIVTALAAALVALLTLEAATTDSRMEITSSVFQEGSEIPVKFTCEGSNAKPDLRFANIPPGAKSLALIMDDPDAPRGLFTHWIMWNIDPKTTEIAEETGPRNAIEGTNDFGKNGYGGPCPPSGTHRYYFKIFALDRTLELKPTAKRAELDAAMRGHVITQGEVMGRFSKK